MTDVRFRPRSSAIFAELGDGSGIVLDLDSKSYFTLNVTAVFLWRKLAGTAASLDELAHLMSEEFDVDSRTAFGDVCSVVKALEAQSLVESVANTD